jgi:hypothetical protein
MGGLRYANIGLAVSMVILVGGVIAFRDSGDGALGVVALATFITAFGVYHFLDERAKRRSRKGAQ